MKQYLLILAVIAAIINFVYWIITHDINAGINVIILLQGINLIEKKVKE